MKKDEQNEARNIFCSNIALGVSPHVFHWHQNRRWSVLFGVFSVVLPEQKKTPHSRMKNRSFAAVN